jgi:hypothetical protein
VKGTTSDHGSLTQWLEFTAPNDPDEMWRVPVAFMLSSWECLFGRGCPGHFGVQDANTQPDVGCCSHGVFIGSRSERDFVQARVDELTDADWDADLRKRFAGDKWLRTIRDRPHGLHRGENDTWVCSCKEEFDDQKDAIEHLSSAGFDSKTRVYNGSCVFNNKTGGSTGKIGCAFHHLGQRTGRPHHDETMPDACWQLPIGLRHDGDGVNVLRPWDADYWGGADDDDKHDSWMAWWCVDTPDAYVGTKPLYKTMERELRKMMGDGSYDRMVELLAPYLHNIPGPPTSGSFGSPLVQKMPGAVTNEGRPMLPLLIGHRTPKRSPR